jgi:hypothetical protein
MILGRAWWYTPVISDIQEAEIGRISIQGQFQQKKEKKKS